MPNPAGLVYRGSKNLISDRLIDQLPSGELFVDAFGGGGAMTDKASRVVKGIPPKWEEVWYNEKNPEVRDAVEQLLTGKLPSFHKPVDRADFESMEPLAKSVYSWMGDMKYLKNVPDDLVRGRIDRYKYINSLKDQRVPIRFTTGDYSDLKIPTDRDAILYSDAPYAGTHKYAGGNFDQERYHQWLRSKDTPNRTFVSEYSVPDDFTVVDRIPKKVNFNGNPQTVEELLAVPRKEHLSQITATAEKRKLSDIAKKAVFGDDSKYTNVMTAFVPTADMFIKLSEGKMPGLLDLPGLSALKAVGKAGVTAKTLSRLKGSYIPF